MREFLEQYSLHRIYILHNEYNGGSVGSKNFIVPTDFIGQTFEYMCEKENAYRTFEIELEPSYEPYYGYGINIHDDFIIDKKLNHTFKAICKCKSCKEYHVDFFLHVFSDIPIPKRLKQESTSLGFGYKSEEKAKIKASVFIEKVGANPEIKVIPNKTITDYFDRETNIWYFKGINALDKNFGIGAFAYFRRIIEKELIKIVEKIKLLPDSHSAEIQKLLDKHKENPKVSTIYENIFEHLPNSLKVLGDNPIKLLYNQTSNGLHSLTEKDCLEKAEKILKILEFVIKKINEEKSEIRDIKETIKGLQ